MYPLIINKLETPNPNAMKFQFENHKISPDFPIEFVKGEINKHGCSSALADELLQKDYIESLFFSHNFISVMKNDSETWDRVASDIILTMMQYEDDINNGTVVKNENDLEDNDDIVECEEADLDAVKMISEFLDEVIRPQIALDGGDIKLRAFKNKIAYLQLKGACSSCPSATDTLYHGVREMLITNIPEVMDIEQVY